MGFVRLNKAQLLLGVEHSVSRLTADPVTGLLKPSTESGVGIRVEPYRNRGLVYILTDYGRYAMCKIQYSILIIEYSKK